MNKLIKFTPLCLIAIFAFVSITSAQEKALESKQKHDGKIDVTFDKEKNETTVKLNELPIFENGSETLSMIIVGSFPGQKPTSSQSEILFMLNAASKQSRYQVEPQLVVIADGEVIRTRLMKNYGSRNNGTMVVEPLLTMTPFDVVTKMTKAKRVTFKINSAEYPLTDNTLEALIDFVSRLTP